MKRQIVGSFFLFSFAPLFLFPIAEAAPSLKVLDGRVKEVRMDKRELVLSYRHPVSGQTEELVLSIDGQTGFSEGVHFEDLRAGEPVSIDYQEDQTGYPRAVRVGRVPLRGVPIDKKSLP